MKNLGEIIIPFSTRLPELLEKLERAPSKGLPGGILLVTDDQGILKGTVTDGDIRRALISKASFDQTASALMKPDPITFPDHFSIQQILESIAAELEKRNRKSKRFLSKIILVNKKGEPTRVFDYHQLWEQRVAIHRHLCIIGLGYVGLTLGLVLADEGYQVSGVDTDEQRLAALRRGESYIHEIGLPELLREQINKNFNVSATIPQEADVFILSVGTPVVSTLSGKKLSTQYLETAVDRVASVLKSGNLVILRSTVPVSTSRNFVVSRLEEKTGLKCGIDFHLSFAPERTAEGKALKELRSLPQIIGGFNNDSVEATAAIFREITPTIVKVDSLEAAEMAKLINNSFRDYIFAYANQVTRIASEFNVNIHDVIRAANEGYPRDPVPLPSPGVGGPCLTKDPYIFSHVAETLGLSGDIFTTAREINISMHRHVADNLLNQLKLIGKSPQDCKVLICGLSFKGNPETGDMRDSTSLEIAELIKKFTPHVYGFDAVASQSEITEAGIKPVSLPDGFTGMDAVLFLNNHKSFNRIDIFEMVRSMNNFPVVYDGWHLFRDIDILQVKPSVYMSLSFKKSSIL